MAVAPRRELGDGLIMPPTERGRRAHVRCIGWQENGRNRQLAFDLAVVFMSCFGLESFWPIWLASSLTQNARPEGTTAATEDRSAGNIEASSMLTRQSTAGAGPAVHPTKT